MTREIRMNKNNTQSVKVCAHKMKNNVNTKRSVKECGIAGFFSGMVFGLASAYTKTVRAKRDISARFVTLSEELADRTAREGLFGEDKGKGYAGTDVDYILE